MKILDTNIIIKILNKDIIYKERIFVTSDLLEEYENAEFYNNAKINNERVNIELDKELGALFYNYYKRNLNELSGRSFFGMTGFGDISIISLVDALLELDERSMKLTSEKHKVFLAENADHRFRKKLVERYKDKIEILSESNL